MPQATPEQIAAYVARVARKTDVRRLLQTGGLESTSFAEAVEPRSDTKRAAEEGLDQILGGRVPSPEQSAGVEAIILPKLRPVLDVIEGDFRTDHPLWLRLNDDQGIRGNLKKAIPSIGRIELPGNARYPYGGTGFVVGNGLLMTNRHVAAIFASGVGMRVSYRSGTAGIDFVREIERPTGPTFPVRGVVMVHPYWDMALLRVELPESVVPLRLSSNGSGTSGTVAAIGYPAFDPRNDIDVQNDLFRRVFGVKRLQPGTLDGRGETESFGKLVSALRHNCSTLGGNSGSALVDIDTGLVVGLHFGGRYRDINYGVPTGELARDPRVVDAGVQFDPKPTPAGPPAWDEWWNERNETSVAPSRSVPRRTTPLSAPVRRASSGDRTVELVVPLHITINIVDGATSVSVGRAEPSEASEDGPLTEKLVEPWHDDEYGSRTGYDAKFLGINVPMPRPANANVVAPTKDGGSVLHYQHFSIVMHAARRLALFTASNVTARPALKKPEPRRQYTRKALSGLGENDQERWFADPRLDDIYQLPDAFYTRDDGAFDKGHIVRREDVAWGSSYDVLRRANGDTYHVTNCSPQVGGFNRSALGEDNWGDLEDHVLKGAASERYCQFAGAVLDKHDDTFIGTLGGGQTVRVKIPSRFWKVIVTRTADGLASYGFVLEQDLSDVPVEFVVPEQFAPAMKSLTEIQTLAGIRFPDGVIEADQYGTDEGLELVMRAGLSRGSGTPGTLDEGIVV